MLYLLNSYCTILMCRIVLFIGAGINGAYKVFVAPTKVLDTTDTKYEFDLPVYDLSLLDLRNTTLYVRGKLIGVESDGKTRSLEPNEKCNIVNNAQHSIFDSVSATIGKNQVVYFVSYIIHTIIY